MYIYIRIYNIYTYIFASDTFLKFYYHDIHMLLYMIIMIYIYIQLYTYVRVVPSYIQGDVLDIFPPQTKFLCDKGSCYHLAATNPA